MLGISWKDWLRKAEENLASIDDCVRGRRYGLALFHAQQVAELSLKALLEKHGRAKYVHDIRELLNEVENVGLKAPEELVQCSDALTLAYTFGRYPVALSKENLRKLKAVGFLPLSEKAGRLGKSVAEKFLSFVKRSLRARAVRGGTLSREAPVKLSIPEAYEEALRTYARRILEKHPRVECIIVHGSLVKGSFDPARSDIDVLIISPEPVDVDVIKVGDRPFCIQPWFRYSREEVMSQLEREKPNTVILDAFHYGIPVHGEEVFAALKREVRAIMRKRGIEKIDHGWAWKT